MQVLAVEPAELLEQLAQPELEAGSEWYAAFTLELQAMVDSITSGKINPILDASLALDALRLCHAEAQSIVSGSSQSI